jgi:hypothetical protein
VMSKFQLHFQCLGNLKIPSKQSVLHWCKCARVLYIKILLFFFLTG